ncbi:hypothetical protein [Psychrosphaera aestuarii]|uniref:hypothetical protein n=1 Tax=Psychrosphaera aestuarii TaxID=1266052 RepID=UPI001B31B4B3|nr:hypothetical protein [Psychrosphaera aestuarii]
MKFLRRCLVPLLLLIAAIAFYRMGIVAGALAFIVIGFFFELAFWSKLFPRKKKKGA